MITIKSMTATFGKLEKARLTCAEGLNLIHAPNEGGKSTWAAFYKAMLFGIDTRDRDKKGYLAAKNRYQPWSGAPMEGEMILDWNGREIAIRRAQRGTTPFGAFSAVYTDTGEKVPGMTGDNCGVMLTGVSREVFERSAFIGGDNMAVTAAPDLEKRIAALLSSGREDVSFSQVQGRLKEWLNRRKVNRTVGLIPKLEEEAAQVNARLALVEECAGTIARLEGTCARLTARKGELEAELELHKRLAQKQLNARFAQAEEDYRSAAAQLDKLEGEMAKFDSLPPKEELKKKQFELQYLKVLDEEIKSAQTALEQAEEDYIQAQIAIQDEHFTGMTGEEAQERARSDRNSYEQGTHKADKLRVIFGTAAFFLLFASVFALYVLKDHVPGSGLPWSVLYAAGGAVFLVNLCTWFFGCRSIKKQKKHCAAILEHYKVDSPGGITALAAVYADKYQTAQTCADEAKRVRGALNDLQARKENSRADIFAFVHTFAPEVRELFGCSAALSRALSLDHELAAARERTAQRRLRRDDLASQGGQPFQTLELLHPPARSEEAARTELARTKAELDQVRQELDHALGRQQAMGDPAVLWARREELEARLSRRRTEQEALTIALETLTAANDALQQRFSPQLNALTSRYFARLTGEKYDRVTLNRELEGEAAQAGAVVPRSALFLSRGAADQLYLAVRLAVCGLCLPERPPILLDDALAAFDDGRLKLALELLAELSQEQQILLFTCQKREGEVLEGIK